MDVSYIKLTSICSSHQVSDCSKFLVSDSLTALYYVSESRYSISLTYLKHTVLALSKEHLHVFFTPSVYEGQPIRRKYTYKEIR